MVDNCSIFDCSKSAAMTNDEERDENIQLYKRRWIFLFANGVYSLVIGVVPTSFSVSNYIYAAYFDVNYASFDWMYMSVYAGTFLVTPLYSWILCKKYFGLRTFLNLGTLCSLFACINILLSGQFPVLFPLIVVAILFSGVSHCVALTLAPTFATLWFPNHHVALAIAIDSIVGTFGVYTGSILPPLFFSNLTYNNLEVTSIVNESIENDCNLWKQEVRSTTI